MAMDQASPRFSIFRAKKMKGWWPLVRLKTAEDFEREEKEKMEAKKKGHKKKKTKDKRSQMSKEDIQYTDSLGNTYLLMVQKEDWLLIIFVEINFNMNTKELLLYFKTKGMLKLLLLVLQQTDRIIAVTDAIHLQLLIAKVGHL